jgi:hypothetical protein
MFKLKGFIAANAAYMMNVDVVKAFEYEHRRHMLHDHAPEHLV